MIERSPSPSEQLLGSEVQGVKKPGKWRVTEKIERRPCDTGGNFSVGYMAEHDDGTKAFLKATDIGLLKRVTSASSVLAYMSRAFSEQEFERNILDICQGNNMDRVVHAIDYGEYETTVGGVRDYVFYIMFEPANGDIRQQVDRELRGGLAWSVLALHNLAVAIQQLHTAMIAHNDIKPSNFLVFDETVQKLADLGRATADNQLGPWDSLKYTGDRTYAAPEFWYANVEFQISAGKIGFNVRQASDLYMLGSMGFFLITGQSITPLIRRYLRPEYAPENWTGTFEEVVPHVRDCLGLAASALDDALPRDNKGNLLPEANELRALILALCEPDPKLRGAPKLPGSVRNQYSPEMFISKFDRISKRLAGRERIRKDG